jgi:hypothetical protein
VGGLWRLSCEPRGGAGRPVGRGGRGSERALGEGSSSMLLGRDENAESDTCGQAGALTSEARPVGSGSHTGRSPVRGRTLQDLDATQHAALTVWA